MYKALVFKELRETALIGGLVFAAMMLVVLDQMGVPLQPGMLISRATYGDSELRARPIPFVQSGLQDMLPLIGAAGALALGFRQVFGESVRGTWAFLMHRPAPWHRIMNAKLAAGAGLLLAATVVPVLILAVWAATPGTHASPFDWRMTQQPLRLCFATTAVYLAAYLAALREARWFGSRLLPLVPAAMVAMWVVITVWWPVTGWVVVLVADLVYLAAIAFATRTRQYA